MELIKSFSLDNKTEHGYKGGSRRKEAKAKRSETDKLRRI